MSTDKIQPCCLKGFRWSGTLQGEEITVDMPIITNTTSTTRKISCYKATPPNVSTESKPKRAILLIHDLFGWTFANNRLLADHYAAETNSAVYLPDFFDGLVIDSTLIAQERFDKIDLKGFQQKNSREIREPEVFAWARYLRNQGYEKVGAVGFCFGGWAGFRLAAQEHEDGGEKLVDCIVAGHPTWLTEGDVDGVSASVGVQILSTEIDMVFTKELKGYTWNKLQEKGVKFEWIHFPGIRHGGLVRGDENIQGEREAMVRAKDKVVAFMGEWLGTD